MTKPNQDADCSAVQQFISANPNPTLALALREVPRLAECLVTHDLVPNAPATGLPVGVTKELRAFGLNFKGADLWNRVLYGGRLRGVNFTGVKAAGLIAKRVEFVGCYFHGADFMGARFIDCTFIGCEVSKNDFRGVRFAGSRFAACDVYANWATGATDLIDDFGPDAFGYGERSPWDEGFCDGHEVAEVHANG